MNHSDISACKIYIYSCITDGWMSVHIFFLIERVLRSKNLLSKSCSEHPITFGYNPLWKPLFILGSPGGHSGFFRRFYVSSRVSAWIKKLFSESCLEHPRTREDVMSPAPKILQWNVCPHVKTNMNSDKLTQKRLTCIKC